MSIEYLQGVIYCWGPEWNEWITKHRIVGNEKIKNLLDMTFGMTERLFKKR